MAELQFGLEGGRLEPIDRRRRQLARPQHRGRRPGDGRARSTIASQLANAAEPMTLLELQQWLGRGLPSSTLHYVKASDRRVATSPGAYSGRRWDDEVECAVRVFGGRSANAID